MRNGIAAVILLAITLIVARKALSAYMAEVAAFSPRTGPVERTAPANAIANLRNVQFTGAQGNRLAGWYAPSKNGAAVLFVHGSNSDRTALVEDARLLADHGYGVLLFDLPGHGESNGSVMWGAAERDAVTGAVSFLITQPDVDPNRIGGLGFSMGAYILIEAAALDTRLRAIVAESSPADAVVQTRFEWRHWGPITQWPALRALRNSPMNLNEPQPISLVTRIAPRAIFVIAGDSDDVVPPSMAHDLFAAAGHPKELWLCHGVGHGGFRQAFSAEYDSRIARFFNNHLLQ